jgi:hypothetical protein
VDAARIYGHLQAAWGASVYRGSELGSIQVRRIAMPKLKLLDIRCIKCGEVGGEEPYLKVRGNKVWSNNDMKAGMTISLRALAPIAFNDDCPVVLMEKDRFRDDELGSATVVADAKGQGQQEINFDEGGSHYQLIYEVLD